jgi:hypothetical protein
VLDAETDGLAASGAPASSTKGVRTVTVSGRRWRTLGSLLTVLAGTFGAAIFPAAAQAQAPAPDISTQPSLYPAFNQAITDYVVRCTADTPVQVNVTTPPGTEVEVDRQGPQSGSFTAYVIVSAGESFQIETSSGGSPTGTYHVRCLPSDFPTWTTERSGQPQAEWYMVNVRGTGAGPEGYAVILDTNGVPVWWFRSAQQPSLFVNLPNGNVAWTFASNATPEEHRLDGSLARSIHNVGATNDLHELMLLPNGNYLIGAIRNRSGFSVCGLPNVTVSDRGIQEIAPDGSLVWEWYPSDHIPTSEVSAAWCSSILNSGAGSGIYDVWHWNSAEPDGDSYVLSLQRMDAIYKVSRSTGAVEWKIGGTARPESLTLVNDPSGGPWGGHDPRVLSDGTVTAHDNGFHPGPGASRTPRAIRYQIDEVARTATLVEQVNDPGTVTAGCCGSARKLPGGNWVMSWGGNRLVTELTPSSGRVFGLSFINAASYRAHPVLPGVLSRATLRAGMDAQQPRMARPGSATPLRVPLVTQFTQCTSPNSTHIPPLDLESCTPATQESSQLTMSDLGFGNGFVKLSALAGDPSTPVDEADVALTTNISDVLRKSDGADYDGKVILRAHVRQTDRANEPFASSAATVEDAALSIPVDCAATPGTHVGGTCRLATTFDTLVPGLAKEGKRAVMSVLSLKVLDAGPDGSVAPTSGACPYTCGSGDEQVFLSQGILPP